MGNRGQCTWAWTVAAAAMPAVAMAVGCATHHTDPPAVSAPIVEVGARDGLDAQRLEQGRDIYGASCQRCHDLVLPEQRTKAEWDNVLPVMFRRAHLDLDQQAAVRQYILAAREVRAGRTDEHGKKPAGKGGS